MVLVRVLAAVLLLPLFLLWRWHERQVLVAVCCDGGEQGEGGGGL